MMVRALLSLFLISFRKYLWLGIEWFHIMALCNLPLQPLMHLVNQAKSSSWYSNYHSCLCWVEELETRASHLPFFLYGFDTKLLDMRKRWYQFGWSNEVDREKQTITKEDKFGRIKNLLSSITLFFKRYIIFYL